MLSLVPVKVLALCHLPSDKDRKLIYNGRIDDNWEQPDQVKRHDLREVLDAALEGRKVDFEHQPSMGCSIKWK